MSDPSDLIDPEAPSTGGARVDTPAYAGAPDDVGAPDLAHPSAAETLDVEAPAPPYEADAAAAPPLADAADGADVLDRGADALLALAADRPWREITLRDVAERAGVSFAALYARAPGKQPLLLRLSDRFDRQALAAVEGDRQPEAHDRLFEAFMARLEAMAPHRDVLIAIGRAEPAIVFARLPRTARALAEASGVDTSGVRGALRLTAIAGAWARALQVWRDDEGAYNRTMAEIDRRLRQASERLARVGAGFELAASAPAPATLEAKPDMSALGRLLARLFGRRPAAPPRPAAVVEPPFVAPSPPPEPARVEPRSELAVAPALGAAAGEAQLIAAEAGVALVGESAPLAEDEEDVFEEEERAEDAEEAAGGPDLDRKIAMREAAVPYLRQVAQEEALSGEHRVRSTDPSGPGTLAEALAQLEAEGRLDCELGEDADGAPLLVYRPKPAG